MATTKSISAFLVFAIVLTSFVAAVVEARAEPSDEGWNTLIPKKSTTPPAAAAEASAGSCKEGCPKFCQENAKAGAQLEECTTFCNQYCPNKAAYASYGASKITYPELQDLVGKIIGAWPVYG